MPTVSTEITAISVVDTGASQVCGAGDRPGASRRSNRGAIYRIRPDGLWDTLWESGDDSPLRPADRTGRQRCSSAPAPKARSSASPAIRRAPRCSRAPPRGRSPRSCANRPAASSAPRATRASCSRCRPSPRGDGHATSPTCATPARSRRWGAIRWRATAQAGPGRAAHAVGQHGERRTRPGARGRRRTRSRTASRSPARTRATCSGARCSPADGAPSPVLTSVTAAYLPRNLRPEVAIITVHPPGTVFQRPFSTGELEIAGFEENTSDGRAPSQAQAGPGDTPPPRAAARPADLPEGPADVRLEGGRRERRSPAVRRLLPPRRRDGVEAAEARPLGSDLRVGHDVGARRHLLRRRSPRPTRRRTAPATALVGELESVSFDIDNTPPRIEVQPATRAGDARDDCVRRPRRAVGGAAGGVSLDASRWRVVYPKDGIPDSRREEFEVTLDDSEAGAQRHHPRDRRDEQRRDARSPTLAAVSAARSRFNELTSRPSSA